MNTCTTNACGNPVKVKKWGLCAKCYSRAIYRGQIPKQPKRTNAKCYAPECNDASAIAGLCKTHYYRNHRYGTFESNVPTERECKHCGTPFTLTIHEAARLYCDDRCYAGSVNDRKRAESEKARASATKTCPQCGDTFTPNITMRQMFCTSACGANAHRDASGKTCTIGDCDRPLRARGMCVMHWKRWGRAEGIIKNEPWDDRRKDNHHRRRARIKGQTVGDRVLLADLMARDNNTCHICGEHVDPTLEYPNPSSKSIDHVVAIAKGGEHSMANTALSHLICNIRKNDRDLDEVKSEAQHA